MRLTTLELPDGRHAAALVSADGGSFRLLDEPFRGDLAGLLASGARPSAGGDPVRDVRFAPLIPRPGSIWCVGLNYEDHRIETGREKARWPTLFTRFPACLLGHREDMALPRVSTKLDYEGELAVVIGKPGRHIGEEDALEHVAGYACFNDGSVRDFQSHSSQFGPGKNFWRTGAFGPWLVTADEIPDPQALAIETRLNGEVMQRSHTSRMTWPVRELIAYLSRITPLAPGDVIATGTPSGVGVARNPRVFLKPGDRVEVEIEGIGVLENGVVAEQDAATG